MGKTHPSPFKGRRPPTAVAVWQAGRNMWRTGRTTNDMRNRCELWTTGTSTHSVTPPFFAMNSTSSYRRLSRMGPVKPGSSHQAGRWS